MAYQTAKSRILHMQSAAVFSQKM